MSDEVVLSELSVEEWLRSFGDYTRSAEGKRGPLNRGAGVSDVVPGVYPHWHYDALAIRRLLEMVIAQQKEIERLSERVRALDLEHSHE